MRIQVDTNILIRALDVQDPQHAVCAGALRQLRATGADALICAQVLIEYWVVATRPRQVNGLGLEPQAVEASIQELEDAFLVLAEPPDMAARWRELANRYAVRGRQAHDTRLVALMLAHGVTTLLTLNPADFARYNEVTCLAPQDV
jgi:predicted nucleic acid-binding protein